VNPLDRMIEIGKRVTARAVAEELVDVPDTTEAPSATDDASASPTDPRSARRTGDPS
jgi:hypothetical protein